MKCKYEQKIFIHYKLTTFHTGYIVKMSRKYRVRCTCTHKPYPTPCRNVTDGVKVGQEWDIMCKCSHPGVRNYRCVSLIHGKLYPRGHYYVTSHKQGVTHKASSCLFSVLILLLIHSFISKRHFHIETRDLWT